MKEYVIRGGSWRYNNINCRTENRCYYTRIIHSIYTGFRLTKKLKP